MVSYLVLFAHSVIELVSESWTLYLYLMFYPHNLTAENEVSDVVLHCFKH